ncbi:hypothetical protein [Flavobacterium sp. LM4]|uniref:hypothetical protein n=1 Tax=Flavobacterium sp. LM4 TaxID=1938609 RepID=UPI000992F398|nr:hypothetical protein [Flavobacterium sp. LM4]OOV20524.1 hypothetical protein BXU10_13305 [Flavobacterium sp. LM4]
MKTSLRPIKRPFCGFSLENGYYYQEKELQYITHKSSRGDDTGIADVVYEIQKAAGFDAKIQVYVAKDENNCMATIGRGGVRMIIADHLFLNDVDKSAKTKWAAISIIAHEVGHHIASFGEDSHKAELDADYWSGYVLQKLGSNKSAATKCIMTYGTEEDTDSHPNKYSRAAMIEKGWQDAHNGEVDYNHCKNCEK